MEITEIKVFPVREEKLKAFVSVVIDECFMVNDIKVIRGRDGYFISMPSRKKKNGKFKDVAHPLNNPTRQMMEGAILAEYDRVVGEQENGQHEPSRPRPAAPAPAAPVEPPPAAEPMAAAAPEPAPEPAPKPAPEPAEPQSAAPSEEAPQVAEEGEEEKTLEEVTEMHLRDSFWNS